MDLLSVHVRKYIYATSIFVITIDLYIYIYIYGGKIENSVFSGGNVIRMNNNLNNF